MKNRKSCFFAIAASGGFILFVIWWIFLGPIVFPKIKLPVAHGQRYAEGNFPLCVRKPGNHNILVRYIIPLDPASGRPLKSASQIVFYAPYNGDSKRIARRLPSWLKFFPEIAGFSVFSFTIDVDNDMIFQKNKYGSSKLINSFVKTTDPETNEYKTSNENIFELLFYKIIELENKIKQMEEEENLDHPTSRS